MKTDFTSMDSFGFDSREIKYCYELFQTYLEAENELPEADQASNFLFKKHHEHPVNNRFSFHLN